MCGTLASVSALLMTVGAEWYAKLGPPKNGGTRLFCLSGNVAMPGVYELLAWATAEEDDL